MEQAANPQHTAQNTDKSAIRSVIPSYQHIPQPPYFSYDGLPTHHTGFDFMPNPTYPRITDSSTLQSQTNTIDPVTTYPTAQLSSFNPADMPPPHPNLTWSNQLVSEPSCHISLAFSDPFEPPETSKKRKIPPTGIPAFDRTSLLIWGAQDTTSQTTPTEYDSVFTTMGNCAIDMLHPCPRRGVLLLYKAMISSSIKDWTKLGYAQKLQEVSKAYQDRSCSNISQMICDLCSSHKVTFLQAYSREIQPLHPVVRATDIDPLIMELEAADLRMDGRVTHRNTTALMILAIGGYCSSCESSTVLYTAAYLAWVETQKAREDIVPEGLLVTTVLMGIYQLFIGNISRAYDYAAIAVQTMHT